MLLLFRAVTLKRARTEKWQQAKKLDSAFLYVRPFIQAQISGTLSPYTYVLVKLSV